MSLALAVVAMIVSIAPPLRAQSKLTVAAAADLGSALREIAADFEKRSGMRVALVFGSSGNLATQINNGAPYDVFLSADLAYPHELEGRGLALLGSLTTYALGKLVLWAPKSSGPDVRALGMKALTAAEVHKIAIANPDHAPYGKAAVAALRRAGVYDAVKSKLVLGENVAQAAQFAASGNAQLGIISESLARSPELDQAGHWWTLPPEIAPPLSQGAVVLRASKNQAAAESFMNFLNSPESAAVLRRYGFAVPEVRR